MNDGDIVNDGQLMVMTVIILSACLLAAKSIVFEQLLSLFKTISD